MKCQLVVISQQEIHHQVSLRLKLGKHGTDLLAPPGMTKGKNSSSDVSCDTSLGTIFSTNCLHQTINFQSPVAAPAIVCLEIV